MTAAVALLVGLGFAAPAHAHPPSYGSNGVFGVGDKPTNGWATAGIPPGRYRVDQSPSTYPSFAVEAPRYLRVTSSHAPPIGKWYVTGDE